MWSLLTLLFRVSLSVIVICEGGSPLKAGNFMFANDRIDGRAARWCGVGTYCADAGSCETMVRVRVNSMLFRVSKNLKKVTCFSSKRGLNH